MVILAALSAMVVEFVYIVRNDTISIYNWSTRESLSIMAESGIKAGETFLKKFIDSGNYLYPCKIDIPVPDIAGDGETDLLITIADEDIKLNINKIVNQNGTVNQEVHDSFKRLLSFLEIKESVADIIIDWIDEDNEERAGGGEENSKNALLYSVDELLKIKGIMPEDYVRLSPYITIYGDGLININGADKFVLMSLSEDITEELAKRLIAYRELTPFKTWQGLNRVAGFETIYTSLAGRITVKGDAFLIEVRTYKEDLIRHITAIVMFNGNKPVYKYWKEV